jgi:hypothetical protein
MAPRSSGGSRDRQDDDALRRELERHYESATPASTLDEALGNLARACWADAGATPNPFKDETAAQAMILRALDYSARSRSEFRIARRVFRSGRFTVPRANKDPLSPRLLRTYWLMATRLWETSVADPARPSGVAFPYLHERVGDAREPSSHVVPNWGKTADAIVRGLKRLREEGDLSYLPDRAAVREALKRQA